MGEGTAPTTTLATRHGVGLDITFTGGSGSQINNLSLRNATYVSDRLPSIDECDVYNGDSGSPSFTHVMSAERDVCYANIVTGSFDKGWADGDFNGDGTVNNADTSLMAP